MPPPLDLTGRRFGRLIVVGRAPARVKFGKWQTSWLCRCDCGAVIAVPQQRLPHADYIRRNPGHIVEACPACRATPCLICGTPISPKGHGTAKTCSQACRIELRRRSDREWKHTRYHDDPVWREKQLQRRKNERRDPNRREQVLATERKRENRKRQRIKQDPIRWQARQAYSRRHYEQNWDRIWAQRRARLDAMSDDEREVWLDRMRSYQREWRREWRADLMADPLAHRIHLQATREWRRQRELLTLSAAITERAATRIEP